MAGGAIFQPLVGKLLDWHAGGALGINGLPLYNHLDYTFALSVIPLGVATGVMLCFFFLKETYCESQVPDEIPKAATQGRPELNIEGVN
jgi:hypothetical protein